MVPLPTLDKAYSLLVERESQRIMSQTSHSSSSSELNALFTAQSLVPKPRFHTNSRYDPNIFCDYCKRTEHMQAVCYKLHGYPPCYERKKKGPAYNVQGRGRSNSDRRSYPSAHNAISDTDHSDFNRVESQRNQGYGRGDRQYDPVDYHKGLNVLHEQYNLILHMLRQSNMQSTTERDSNPSFQCKSSSRKLSLISLLSVSKITKDLQCAVCLYLNFVTIQDLSSGQVKEIGREQAGLYLIPHPSSSTDSTTSQAHSHLVHDGSSDSQTVLWHQRLDHTSSNVLARTLNLPVTQCSKEVHNFTICPLAKQPRLPFTNSSTISSSLFQLIHIDV
ncbi:uncharacterized protein [Solanum lycopersicum]|uniref:uncharacterized protein n=1 Tax=Solanum lycopersicum TaxID=4081 RepID=UPI003748DD44